MDMGQSIPPIHGTSVSTASVRPEARATDGSQFGRLIESLLENTEAQQDQVGVEFKKIMGGESASLHEVSLAVANADLSFRFMMQVRDQLIQTYREVMRMQV